MTMCRMDWKMEKRRMFVALPGWRKKHMKQDIEDAVRTRFGDYLSSREGRWNEDFFELSSFCDKELTLPLAG